MSAENKKVYNLLDKIRVAIAKGEKRKFRNLLHKNADVTRNQSLGSTFIEMLVEKVSNSNNEKMIKILAEFFKSETENDLKQKQLIIAVLQGNLEKAKLLLENEVKIEHVGKDWNPDYIDSPAPALFSSALLFQSKVRKEMLGLLIKHGLNIHITSDCGKNLYHILGKRTNFDGTAAEIAEVLFDSGLTAIDQIDKGIYSPLHYAILYKNFKLVEFFINKGADIIRSEGALFTFPLTYAFISGNEDIIDILIANGADINAQEKFTGWAALHEACKYCNANMIRLLLKKGADMDLKNEKGKTSLLKLKDNKANYKECLIIMVKELSKTSSISQKNLDYIQSHPMAQKLFQKCLKELSKMRKKLFYAPYSYYSVLMMSKKLKKLANLLKNEDFVAAFKNDLKSFSLYAEDLKSIVVDATRVRDESVRIISYLKSAFGDIFPDVVLEYLAKNLNVKDIKYE